jgi:4-aminobutyrate aminotransferase-like enzyme
VGVTIARPEIADSLKGLTISTFGGNPITMTQAKAVLDFIEENKLKENCTVVGAHLRDRLLELQKKYPMIGEVRGMGLLQGLELVRDPKTKEPATKEMAALMERTRENGILVGKGGLYGNALRISPPMNIGKSDVDDFIKALDKSFSEI